MNAYAYEVSARYEGHEVITKTDNIQHALRTVRDAWNNNAECVECISDYTGEVLMYTDPHGEIDCYMSPEFKLMWLGFTLID